MSRTFSSRNVLLSCRLLMGLLLAYLTLWALTDVVGTRSVRGEVTIRAAGRSDASICSPTFGERHYGNPISEDGTNLRMFDHYCSARALGPFLVRLEFGQHCGPLCGSGADVWVIWIPGRESIPIYVPFSWSA